MFENDEFCLSCNDKHQFKKKKTSTTRKEKVQNKLKQGYVVFKFNLFAERGCKGGEKISLPH